MTLLPTTDIDVSALCLGGNVFGWTSDEAQSHQVLDAFVEAGQNFVDTADVYSAWAPGHTGGESETVLGTWMASRSNRDRVVIATKVAQHPDAQGLSQPTMTRACEASLRRLQTDHIDLYYAHVDDPDTPQEETLAAFDALVRDGKVRAIAASNFSAERLRSAQEISEREGLARYVAVQDRYNLMARSGYEGEYAVAVAELGLLSFPYSGLATGFLTGKYRDPATQDSPRTQAARAHQGERGERVLDAVAAVADAHGVTMTAVSLAWLAAQPTVSAPIASARTVEQLPDLLAMVDLQLTPHELAQLADASAP